MYKWDVKALRFSVQTLSVVHELLCLQCIKHFQSDSCVNYSVHKTNKNLPFRYEFKKAPFLVPDSAERILQATAYSLPRSA